MRRVKQCDNCGYEVYKKRGQNFYVHTITRWVNCYEFTKLGTKAEWVREDQ